MKRLGFLLSIGVLVAGCATPDPRPGARYDVDSAQVSAVERAARHSGVQVYWINYPRKKVDD